MPGTDSALAHLVEILGESEVRSVVKSYLEHTAQQLTALAALTPEKQLLAVHGMKGSSSQVGATLFAAQCRAVESQLRDEHRAVTPDEIAALRAGFAECSQDLTAWLKSAR